MKEDFRLNKASPLLSASCVSTAHLSFSSFTLPPSDWGGVHPPCSGGRSGLDLGSGSTDSFCIDSVMPRVVESKLLSSLGSDTVWMVGTKYLLSVLVCKTLCICSGIF